MSMKETALELIRRAHAEGRDTLLEPELYALLQAGGVPTPAFWTATPGAFPDALPLELPGRRAVVKVVSPAITHKTEMGGVRICDNTYDAIRAAADEVVANVRERGGDVLAASVRQVLVGEFVVGDDSLGGQVFAGMRHSPDMGPVLALGFGGLDAEEMAARFQPGQGLVLASPLLSTPEGMLDKLRGSFLYRRVVGQTREARKRVDDAAFLKVLGFFADLAALSNAPDFGFVVRDFEVNPFFTAGGRLVAVDAFLRFAHGVVTERTVPLGPIDTLLKPRTVAIMGVSGKDINPGRVILRNLLREAFPAENIRVIRPDAEPIDGVACCPSLTALPWRADLVVVSVAAPQVPGIIDEVLATGKAASMILIPGGLGETEAGKADARRILDEMAKARAAGRPTPVLVGPNCLGIRSRPGRYDTLFIPATKLPLSNAPESRCALVCQSGAFLITRINNLSRLTPRYAISTGNQMDLALVDFVEAILAEGAVDVLGLYVEGFGPLDGLRLARLVRRARAEGKDVILYKAGRTPEGSTATSSHTASISGDYVSCVEVMKDAGALVTESFQEFNLLLDLAVNLHGKRVGGMRLGAVSNAGYETVGMADNLSQAPKFHLARYADDTARRIQTLLDANRLTAIVSLRNPLDITPMAPDKVYVEAAAAMAEDAGIDAVVVGIIPLTPAMRTLPPGVDPRGWDTIEGDTALPALLPPIVAASDKPIIATVDAGPLYDPLAEALRRAGVPTYRSVDMAMPALQRYMAYRLGRG